MADYYAFANPCPKPDRLKNQNSLTNKNFEVKVKVTVAYRKAYELGMLAFAFKVTLLLMLCVSAADVHSKDHAYFFTE